MKRMRKLMALVIAVAMVLAMGVVAFAADPEYDNPLTITDLAEGDVAHFYQVIEWVGNAEGNVSGWKAVAPFDTVLTEAKLKEVLVGNPDAQTPVAATGITAALAGELAKKASSGGEAVTVLSDKKAVLNNEEPGLWMALITPIDVNTVYNPVFVASDYNKEHTGDWAITEAATYSDQAAAKKSTLTLTKTASTNEDTWDDGKSYSTAVGDTVTFTVTTAIPGYGTVYTNPHFVMTDTLTALQLKQDTVTLVEPANLTKYIEGAEEWDYKVETTTSGYTITFSPAYLKTVTTPKNVKVTYDAIVTTDAAASMNPEKNEVQIEYSHDPSNESDYDYKKDTTQHYTFSLDADAVGGYSSAQGKKTSEIVKIGVKADGTPITETRTTSEITSTNYVTGPLAGAVFGLYTDAACTTPYVPKKADGTAGDQPMTNITTLADGRMHIDGLDAGTYYLKEISAPAGYIKDDKAYKIEIAAFTKEVTVTETIGGKTVTYKTDVLDYYTVKVDGKNTAEHHFTNNGTNTDVVWTDEGTFEVPFPITNTQGTELPTTGGIGTTIFYIVGAILVIGGGILLVSRRRMSSN